MSDSTTPTMDSGEPSELEQRLTMTKRSFVRLFLGSAAAYSVPLMASFSMEGLGIGKAHAQTAPEFAPGVPPPGFLANNQFPAMRVGGIQRINDSNADNRSDRAKPMPFPD
jgi:hypothetical protein